MDQVNYLQLYNKFIKTTNNFTEKNTICLKLLFDAILIRIVLYFKNVINY